MKDLPDRLRPFVEALGEDGALKLLLEVGGTPVYLTPAPQPDSQLVRAIGTDAVRNLARVIGTGHVRVPLCKEWVARRLRGQGLTIYEIARRMRVTDRAIRDYLKDDPARQGDLFTPTAVGKASGRATGHK